MKGGETARVVHKIRFLPLLIVAALLGSCSTGIQLDHSIKERHARVERCLEQLGQAGVYPGLEYVVFDSSGIIDSHAVGYAVIANRRPMLAQTRMNVFSTTILSPIPGTVRRRAGRD